LQRFVLWETLAEISDVTLKAPARYNRFARRMFDRQYGPRESVIGGGGEDQIGASLVEETRDNRERGPGEAIEGVNSGPVHICGLFGRTSIELGFKVIIT
jgi:hypothetical protein